MLAVVTHGDTPTLSDLEAASLLPEPPTAVYVSGSRVIGFGHANSDVDVFVVSAAPPALLEAREGMWVRTFDVGTEPAEITGVITFVDGERCDVEYWTEGQVEQLLQRVEDADVAGGAPPPSLGERETDFLFRLSVGAALVGEDWLAGRRERVRRSGFAHVLAAQSFTEADELVEDAVGQLRSGDYESAVLTAHPAFGFAVDGLLALAGELYPNPKWRARKLRRTPLEALPWEEYWAFETMQGLDPAEPREWVERAVARTQELMMGAEFT